MAMRARIEYGWSALRSYALIQNTLGIVLTGSPKDA